MLSGRVVSFCFLNSWHSCYLGDRGQRVGTEAVRRSVILWLTSFLTHRWGTDLTLGARNSIQTYPVGDRILIACPITGIRSWSWKLNSGSLMCQMGSPTARPKHQLPDHILWYWFFSKLLIPKLIYFFLKLKINFIVLFFHMWLLTYFKSSMSFNKCGHSKM